MARRRGRAGSRPLPWLYLGILLLLGVALFIARAGRGDLQPSPGARTPTPAPTARSQGQAPAPALAALPTATATPPRASATITVRAAATSQTRVTAQPTPTAGPTHSASTSPVARPTGQVVALTFDAGADRGYTEDILDVLHTEAVTASFGITGQWARANPDLVRRMAAEGHMVFNHTLDHRSFTGLSDQRGGLTAAARRAELEDADAIVAPLIGHSTRPFYRLPYGDDDARVAADVAPAGYTRKIGWTVDTLGWHGASTGDIVERSLRLAAPGAIYILHVGHASQDGPALSRIVTALRARGFGFVTVDSLPE